MAKKINHKRVKSLVNRGRVRLCRKDIAHVMETLLECTDLQKVTRYLSPVFVVRAVRQQKPDARSKRWTVVSHFRKTELSRARIHRVLR